MADELGMDARAIREALECNDRMDFDDTRLYARTFALADAHTGKALPRAMIPAIRLAAPRSPAN